MTGMLLAAAYTALLVLWMRRQRFYNAVPGLGFRWVEAFIISLLGVIFVCFFIQIAACDTTTVPWLWAM